MTEPNADQETSPSGSSIPLLGHLSGMMFLQYFVQGSYLPIASLYVQDALDFDAEKVGVFIAALAIGPILAPFIVGQLVDRVFATQRVMAACHLLGGLLMLALYSQTGVWSVIVLGTLYSIVYVPTMMLSNSLAFQHLKNSDMEFPWIRLFGTLGYIAPAFLIELWWLRGLSGTELDHARGIAFAISGVMGIVMALYCLTLPHTPPRPRGDRKYAPGVVVAMLRQRHLMVLVGVSFLIAAAHQYIVSWYGPFLRAVLDSGKEVLDAGKEFGAYEQRISSVGQMCEIGVLIILGLLIKKLGFKWTMILGIAAYTLRCFLYAAVFGLDPPFAGKLALAVSGQALHGFCFGCFLAVAYMYVDRVSPKDVRGSMQNLYGVFVVSTGFFIGGLVGGIVVGWLTTGVDDAAVRDWTSIWLFCALLCTVCLVAMILLFPKKVPEPAD